jgi:excisionase family DNA binding protein
MHTVSLKGQSDALALVPTMLDVPQAARLLGIGRTLAYELVRTGEWPTPVVRVGRLIKIPSGPLVELLATGRTLGSDVAGIATRH